MTTLTLTPGQKKAQEMFTQFYLDPDAKILVIEGYSGTGKTTLVKHLIDLIPNLERTLQLIDPSKKDFLELILTATTNKAAENFSQITGHPVSTIHSKLRLRVRRDYRTGETCLVAIDDDFFIGDALLVIDEASYIDDELKKHIFSRTRGTKILMIGDPAQLLNVNSTTSPIFNAGFPTAKLTEVVRQSNQNPILELSTKFRETVNTQHWFRFRPDGHHIQHLPRHAFEQHIVAEFTRPDWKHNDSKVLAWTNKTVVAYNKGINSLISGMPHFQVGDYAICNRHVKKGEQSIKTDQTVLITDITPAVEHDTAGNLYVLDGRSAFFMPTSLEVWKARIRQAKEEGDYHALRCMEEDWIDLRAAYASTINKSQGSTYNTTFIDLDDVKKCGNPDQLARMLYVGVSRARDRLVLTGDLV